MKNTIQRLASLSVLMIAFVAMPMQASTIFTNTSEDTLLKGKNDLVGGWEYSTEGAPEGYESGFLLIVKNDDTYQVQVQINGSAINGTNINVKGNTISFNLMIEGENVTVELTARGSKITGSSTSSSGVYSIMGTKSLSPQ